MHYLSIAALASLVVLVSVSAQDLQSPAPVFRSGVSLVRLDVKVVDGSGAAVTDLSADELRIEDGADPRPIVLFRRVAGGGRGYVDAARRSVAGDISTNQDAPQGQLYVLVFDQEHIRAGGEPPVRAAADAFLRDHVRPQDRVAVYGVPGPGPAQPFTANPSAARRQLSLVRGGLERRSIAAVAEMSVHEAYEIMRGNEAILSRFTTVDATGSGLSGGGPLLELSRRIGDDPAVVRRLVRENAQTIVAAADGTARQFLGAFTDLLRSFRGIDGRKTVVLFSEGFHADNVGRELELVAAAAAETYSVVYGFDLNRRVDAIGSDRWSQDDAIETASRIEPLGSLAAETSGRLLKDASTRLGHALSTLLPDEGGYYLIGFEPGRAGTADGAYRRVKISTTRPGARVIARTGYSAAAPPADRRSAIDTALGAPFTQQGLRIQYTTYVGQGTVTGQQRVAVSLQAQLPVAEANRETPADVVFVVRESRTGRVAASGSDALTLPAAAVPGRSTGDATWQVGFNLPAGDYIMRCVVREPGGVVGSADRRFTVPPLDGSRIATTDLIVDSPGERFPVRPAVYERGALTGLLRIVGPAAALEGLAARLELTPVAANADQRIGRVGGGVVGETIMSDRGVSRDVTFHMPLERLPAGEYVARAIVRAGSTVVADVRRTVEVVPGGPPAGAADASAVRAREVLDGEIGRRVLRETIASARAAYGTAAAAAAREAWAEVLGALERAPAEDPTAQRLRGLAALATDQYALAAATLGSAFGQTRSDGRLAFVLGWANVGAGDRPGAIGAFRNAAFLQPDLIAAHIALCEAYLAGGHVDLARQAVAAGLLAVPDSVELQQLAERIGGQAAALDRGEAGASPLHRAISAPSGAPRAHGAGMAGVPASARVGGSAGAKPPGSS